MRWLFKIRGLLRLGVILTLVLLLLAALGWAVGTLQDWRVAVAAVGVVIVFVWLASRARRWVPRRTILEVDFERGVVERLPLGLAGRATPNPPLALRDLLDALHRAGDDRRIVGLVARLGTIRAGLAIAQELREAILAFRAKGKRAVAWAETLGEGQSATGVYYLATAFDRIHLLPAGDLGLNGILVRQPFARGAFERVGVDPQLGHRSEYKTFKYMFTERGFNEPHRESTQALLDSFMDQIVKGIATGRGLEEGVVRELIDRGPYRASEAADAGLVDRLSYRDEVYGGLKEEMKGRFLHLDRYLKRAGRPHRKGATVALVHGVGSIDRGRNRPGSLFGGPTMGSDDVTASIRKAVKSKRVKAIILRVDSPGGSAVASDVIWREVRRAREEGTPVVASMGNLAASGGYYVSVGADKIVAQPGTITGSIGVVLGKFVTREAWKRLGIDWDSIQFGQNAELWSPSHDFGEKGWAAVEGLLDAVYDDFKQKVADSRGLSPEDVEAVAKGRVWTGIQAKEKGLVDEVGGLATAIDLAKELGKIPPDAPVRLKLIKPRRKTIFGTSAEDSSEAAAALLGPLADVTRQLGQLNVPGPLTMPPLDLSTGP